MTAPARPPFPPAFHALLQQILQRAARVAGAPSEQSRTRRRRLAQSGVFTGHRHYVPGDDLRLLDWNAYARSGVLYVKQLEEEEARSCSLVLDCSGSMIAGAPQRLVGAQRLAAILGGLALQHLDGLRVFAGGHQRSFAGAAALGRLLDFLGERGVQPVAPMAQAQELLRAGAPGKVVWLSDFAAPEEWELPLAMLRRHGCRLAGWLPAVADDRDAAVRGWVRLWDPESGREEPLFVDDALAAELRAGLQRLRRHQDAVFAVAGYPLHRFALPAEGDFSLPAWLEAAWRFRR